MAEPTDITSTYDALLYFPHTILLRVVYGESFFFEDHMGKESEDHMGIVPVEDYVEKGPRFFTREERRFIRFIAIYQWSAVL